MSDLTQPSAEALASAAALPVTWRGDPPIDSQPPPETEDAGEFDRWQRKRIINNQRTLSHDTPDMHHDWLRATEADVPGRAALRELVEEREGGGVVLLGPPGRGKTHLAGRWTLWARTQGVAVRWLSVPEMLEEFRVAMRDPDRTAFERKIQGICNVEALVLDDLGAERLTDSGFVPEQIVRILTARFNGRRHLRTVVTTNLIGQALVDQLGERIASRLMGLCDGGTLVHVDGPDRRLAWTA